jgi:hypothetical protein
LGVDDYDQWLPQWDHNRFFDSRFDATLPPHITQLTWSRFFDGYEPVFALVAERHGRPVGFAHSCATAARRTSGRPAICRICPRSTANTAKVSAAR